MGPGDHDTLDHRLAHFYDLEYHDYVDDLDFYVQYASYLDPDRSLPILELGCGTGRITLALAEAGFQVTAMDSSPGMLEILARDATRRSLSNYIAPVQADMRDLAGLPRRPHNLALCALNTFAYLTITEDQLSMLTSVRPLLVQHGILILDLTPPWPHLFPPSSDAVLEQGTFADHETGIGVRKLVSGVEHPATQTHNVTICYEVSLIDGEVRGFTQELILRWTGRYEMELLLRSAGYSLEKVYGDYDLSPFTDDSERMIFVART